MAGRLDVDFDGFEAANVAQQPAVRIPLALGEKDNVWEQKAKAGAGPGAPLVQT